MEADIHRNGDFFEYWSSGKFSAKKMNRHMYTKSFWCDMEFSNIKIFQVINSFASKTNWDNFHNCENSLYTEKVTGQHLIQICVLYSNKSKYLFYFQLNWIEIVVSILLYLCIYSDKKKKPCTIYIRILNKLEQNDEWWINLFLNGAFFVLETD